MKTSRAGIDLIKEFEGLRLQAYLCPAGKPTIGYGHTKTVTLDDVKKKRKITEEVADSLLAADIISFEKSVSNLVEVELTQGQFDALVSFAFNFGAGKLQNSTLLRLVNQEKFLQAADEFPKWVNVRNPETGKLEKLPGLMRRRQAEKQLFLS